MGFRSDAIEEARAACGRGSWERAFELLAAADAEAPLDPRDLELLALTAYLSGRDVESDDAWLRAHEAYLRAGEVARAARCAFWQTTCLLFRGDIPAAAGWIARGRRVLERDAQPGVEHGWLRALTAMPLVFAGDADAALPHLEDATAAAERFGDPDLAVLSGLGRALVMMLRRQTGDAIAVLDEIMVSLPSEQLSPIVVGIAYCQAIDICGQLFEVHRAREWTDALSRWCDARPDLVPYRGNCLVHRCEVFQLGGAWREALDAAERACEWLSRPAYSQALGSAYYQLGEIHRLRGELEEAEDAYRRASRAGRDPEPGMSLLRLAQGPPAVAAAAIRRALAEAEHPVARSKILPAHVEIMLAARDLGSARSSAAELGELAADLGAPYLQGLAEHAAGSVLLAAGDARKALPRLRAAHAAWRDLDAPYQAARARELIATACRALDDHASAELEADAARLVYEELGAAPDLARLERLTRATRPGLGGLTAREVEVLTLVASGKTNRAVAAELVISEKTVARHLSNIFTKLGLASRAEATAYAYEHGLV